MVIPGTKHGSTAAHIEETLVQEIGNVTVAVILETDLFPDGKNLFLALWRIGGIRTVETVFVLKGRRIREVRQMQHIRIHTFLLLYHCCVSNHTYKVVTNVDPKVNVFNGGSKIVGMKISVREMSTRKDSVGKTLDIGFVGRSGLGLAHIRDVVSLGKGKDKVGAGLESSDINLGDKVTRARDSNKATAEVGILLGVKVVLDDKVGIDSGHSELELNHFINARGSVSRPNDDSVLERISGSCGVRDEIS
jgi:hypothetical protein